jgi:hypothetical protein
MARAPFGQGGRVYIRDQVGAALRPFSVCGSRLADGEVVTCACRRPIRFTGCRMVEDREQLAVQAPAAGRCPGTESIESGVGNTTDGESAIGHDCNMTS